MTAVLDQPPAAGHGGIACPPCPHTHPVEEAARLIGVAARTLLDKAGRREIPSTRVGREVTFTDEQIAEIIAAGERAPSSRRVRRDSRRRS